MDALVFLKKIDECTKNYRKVQNETFSDSDCAHFFDPKLKKFLEDNKKEVNALFEIKGLTAFQKFLTTYMR